MKRLLSLLFIIPCFIGASEKEKPMRIFLTTNEGHKVRLYHNGNGFYVRSHGKRQEIEPAMMDKQLRNITKEQLTALTQKGSLRVNKTSDGSYSLRAHVNGNGGGWLTGWAAYIVTKALLSPIYVLPGGIGYAAAVEAAAVAAKTAGDNIPNTP